MDKQALIIIDVQLAMFAENDCVYNANELLATLQALISRARAANVPIIYVQHDSEELNDPLHPHRPGWAIHPAILPTRQDGIVHKRHPDSFQDTGLQAKLESLGVDHLIVAGLQTEYCIDTTCRRAYSLGYPVTLVQDGHSTFDTNLLKASQIIDHHNQVLASWFVKLKPSGEIQFGADQA